MMVALITWMWQGLAIAAATAAFLACAPRLSAAARHLCWWVACGAVVALPAGYVLASTFRAPPTSAAVPLPAAPDALQVAVLLAWVGFTVAGLVRVALSFRTLGRLKRSAQPLDPGCPLAMATSSCGQPAIGISDEITGACALGLGRPVILLGRTLIDELDHEAVEAIVTHERAHLERRDDWWQLLDSIVFALAGWHPGVWLITRRIALEREAACDDVASAVVRDARAYARALVRVAAARTALHEGSALVPGATASRSVLRQRIERLLNPDLARARHVSPGIIVTAAVATSVAIAVSARMPALVTVVDAVIELPHVRVPWTRLTSAAGPATIVPATVPVVRARPATPTETARTEIIRTAPTSFAAVPLPSLEPQPQLESHASAPLTPLASTQTVGAAETGPPTLATSKTSPGWSALGRTAASAGIALGRSGAATGDRARDAGVSLGRFVAKTSKVIAAGF